MWQVKCCSNCGNEIFTQPSEFNVLCDNCEELIESRQKVEEYEKLLRKISNVTTHKSLYQEWAKSVLKKYNVY